MIELVAFIARLLVDDPEAVSVTETVEGTTTIIQLRITFFERLVNALASGANEERGGLR